MKKIKKKQVKIGKKYKIYSISTTILAVAIAGALAWVVVTNGPRLEASYDKGYAEATEEILSGGDWSLTSTILIDDQNGTEPSSITGVKGEALPALTRPTNSGFSFAGYFTEPCGAGTQYYSKDLEPLKTYDLKNGATLYACWASTLNIDLQGGQGVTSQTYIKDLPLHSFEAPTREGYTFGGYFSGKNGTGTQYYDSEMNSTYIHDLQNGVSMFACWIPNE